VADTPQVFALNIASFVDKAKAAPAQVVRKVGLDMATRVVMRSPVDTGRFRANWNVAFGHVDTLTTPSTDKSGGKTRERVRIQLNGWAPGAGDIFLTNSLPYAIPLEYGHSKSQAPQGMVRLTVAEFQTFVNAAVAEQTRQ
jgi:hypothetical protein